MHNFKSEKFVAYHRMIERRMDGSSGGVIGAILETAAKEDYFFTGTVYDADLRVHHVITDNPEEIKGFSGFKPFESDTTQVFEKIPELIKLGHKVIFCGTPKQCLDLKAIVGNSMSLLNIDIICGSFAPYSLLDAYVREIEKKYKSKVTNIRFYNKEYSAEGSKRIILENGRVVYVPSKDSFDFVFSKMLLGKGKKRNDNNAYDGHVGDITIGAYNEGSGLGKFGSAYISINTLVGQDLFNKTKKRLVIEKEGDNVDDRNILYIEQQIKNKENDFHGLPLDEYINITFNKTIKARIISKLKQTKRVVKHLAQISQFRIIPLYRFIKYNFFTKGIYTDFANNGFIYISPYCEFLLDKDIKIELHGPLDIGVKRIPKSKLETRLRMSKGAKLVVYEKCMFGYGSNIEIYKDALLEVGNLFSNSDITMICGSHIKIGSIVNIAKGCTVRDTNGHIVATNGFKLHRPVTIGNHTWICSNSTIMPGVSLGDGVIVGSCSYVTKNVKSYTMVQGNPAIEVGNPQYFKM